MTEILLTILLAVLLDRLVPDRQGFKPFAWYRDWAESIEHRFNGGKRVHGVGAAALAILPIVIGVLLARYILAEVSWILRFVFDVVMLYLCLDIYRLGNSGKAISDSLESANLRDASEQLRELTGKGAQDSSESGIAHATVEAVLKQGNSLVISPLFWFVLLGPVGAIVQRLACILDMMWGHRYERFVEFGWAAARFDDLMGWIPARITALSYAIMGSFEDALRCWRLRVDVWSDINSGPLLASGFGAMHMQDCASVPEPGEYDDRMGGLTVVPDANHVRGVVALVWRVLLFWLVVGMLMTGANLVGIFAH